MRRPKISRPLGDVYQRCHTEPGELYTDNVACTRISIRWTNMADVVDSLLDNDATASVRHRSNARNMFCSGTLLLHHARDSAAQSYLCRYATSKPSLSCSVPSDFAISYRRRPQRQSPDKHGDRRIPLK